MMYSTMLGGLISNNNNQGTDWGEQLLNTVASQAIRHLFTQSEQIEVKVRCHPSSKLLQGAIDSFKMSGRGLVIRKDFRTEEMSFETDAVAIDFSSLLQGKISLKQATQAIAQVKLSENDINKAFEAELVKKRLENLTLSALMSISNGQAVSFRNVQLELLPHNQVKLSAKAHFEQQMIPLSLQCSLSVIKRKRIAFNEIKLLESEISPEYQEIAQQLTTVLGDLLNEMVDLERFDLDGVTMRLNRLETSGQYLLFTGYAKIDHFPGTG